MFGRIGVGELVLILAIALIIFGPAKLPELGKVLGEAVRNFRKSSEKLGDEISGAAARASTPTSAPTSAPASAPTSAPMAAATTAPAPMAAVPPRQEGVAEVQNKETLGAVVGQAEKEKA